MVARAFDTIKPRPPVISRGSSELLRLSRASELAAAAVVLLALLAPLRRSSTPLAAEQPAVDPNSLPKFPPVAARGMPCAHSKSGRGFASNSPPPSLWLPIRLRLRRRYICRVVRSGDGALLLPFVGQSRVGVGG
jgi:hypothetical protein